MSELRIETLQMPAADLGSENPLPPLRSGGDVHMVHETPGIPDDMQHNIRYGRVPNILPYTMQDGYNRQRQIKDFRVAVLENDILRATFLLEYGGRLWSLFHKPSQRELLAVNPVFQPANLALRNAWFSGGVEWNIGTIGHWPLTCSPLFAARVATPEGTPVLRMYEWERIRQVPFQIDAYLPDHSPVLLVRIRIINPHDRDIPMYWWSNMAVPESLETRVIVPATETYRFDYRGGRLYKLPVPAFEGVDMTYTTHSQPAADYFFHLPEGQRRWIAALDGAGKGLIQFSTDRLQGRKLFMWGTGTGGQNWQTFLSEPGHPYLEIQAGLARTQLEHLRMPARTEWDWLEGYGLMEAEAGVIYGGDWNKSVNTVEDQLERLMSRAAFEAEFAHGVAWINRKPDELMQRGSGWGALERLRREESGEAPFCGEGLIFDDESLGEQQTPWLQLLRKETFPEVEPPVNPAGFMVQREWRERLEQARNWYTNWLVGLHLGVMYDYRGERDKAREAWERSVQNEPTALALRNLALLAAEEGKLDEAVDLYMQAETLQPESLPLLIEVIQVLLRAGRPMTALELIEGLPANQRQHGRIRLLEGQAALAKGDLPHVERILATPFVVDTLREGEPSLSDLWFSSHEQRVSAAEGVPVDAALRARVRREFPLAREFDFRMMDEG